MMLTCRIASFPSASSLFILYLVEPLNMPDGALVRRYHQYGSHSCQGHDVAKEQIEEIREEVDRLIGYGMMSMLIVCLHHHTSYN